MRPAPCLLHCIVPAPTPRSICGACLRALHLQVYIMRHKLAPMARSVVVVVGAGHLQGIREKWESEVDFDEIMRVP